MNETNLTVAFSSEFDWQGGGSPSLRIAAATVYRAELNGEFVGWGPARTVGGHAVVDTVPLTPRKGLNRLEVKVSGYNLSSYQYVSAPSFLAAEVVSEGRVLTATPGNFSASESNRCRTGPVYSRQRGFVSESYALEPTVKKAGLKLTVCPKPVYLERRTAYPTFKVVQAKREGDHWRFPHIESGFGGLSFRCVKPGRIAVEFDEARGTNAVVDLWRNGDPFSSWHAMNNRLVWDVRQAGEYRVETMEPYTMQYLRVVPEEGEFADARPYLRQCRNPLVNVTFKSSDPALDRLVSASLESLAQNSVDIFTDCPSRERVGWLCDTYFTANAAAWFTGDFAIEQEYLLNFARTDKFGDKVPPGAIPGFMPSESGGVMPTYMLWYTLQCVQAADRLAEAERRQFLSAVRKRIEGIQDWIAGYEKEGLLEDLPGWVFIEWSKANSLVRGVNFPANMLWAYSLEKCGLAYGRSEWVEKARKVRSRIRTLSRDAARHVYCDQAVRGRDGKLAVNGKDVTEVCQYYAFFTGVATPEADAELFRALKGDVSALRRKVDLVPADAFIGWMLRCHLLSVWGLDEELCRTAKGYYGRMAEEDGTLWEFADGHDSRCHAFGSNAGALVLKAVLGIDRIDWPRRMVRLGAVPRGLDAVEAEFPLSGGGVARFRIARKGADFVRDVSLPDGWTTVGEGTTSACAQSLEDLFRSPPPSARPETWWHWMNGNVTHEGIVADLDAMAAIGIGGVHIFDAGCAVPPGPLQFNTPEWLDTIRFAVSEATKRGMSVTLANCSGYSAAGGPWIAPSNAMKTVCYTLADVKGPQTFDGLVAPPGNSYGFYEDIAVLAYPVPKAELATMEGAGGRVVRETSGTTTVCAIEFPAPFEASAVDFRMSVRGWDVPAHLVLEAETRSGWRRLLDEETYAVAQGQIDENRRAFQFDATAAARWRLTFSFPQVAKSISLSDVRLTRGLRIPNIANKAYFLRSYERMKSYEALADQVVPQASVVDLTSKMKRDGTLRWAVPAGDWRILRIGYAANGKSCHPASAKGVGFESDKLSKQATDLHFDAYIGRVCDHLGPRLAGNVESGFKSILVDSWEAGSQNWTQGFDREFFRRKGYDIRTHLPVLTGAVVDGKEASERFLADYRDVISQLFRENFAEELAHKCHERGLKLTLEPYGTFPATPEMYVQSADIPMCEFWVPPAFGLDDRTVRLVSDLVHASRPRAIIAAEAFTGKPDESRWQQDPFSLKAVGDKMYAIGVNRIVYHRYAHQPWTDRRYSPGMTMGAWGMHFERTETWWYEAKEWISYQTRCQALLQAGTYVDSCRNPELRWLERRYDDGTIGFFVTCDNPVAKTVRVELPSVGSSVEFWDAETGEITLADDWYVEDDRTRLSVDLKPSGSVFVMMRPQATAGVSARRRFSASREQAVPGPWNVSFAATYPAPRPIVLERLMTLSEHPSADIRHFSGSSTYQTVLECERAPDERIVLVLGEVKNLAEVSVNGIRFPVLWRPPFRVDITDAVKQGMSTNALSIRVVNLWVNRLIGDESLPSDVEWQGNALAAIPDWVKRGEASPTGRNTFTTWHHWRKGDPLPKSGLLGPVRLLTGRR